MSGGLMSCVRENSPPLDMDVNVSGPLSLPEPSINNSDLMGSMHSSSHHNIMSSTPLAAQPTSSAHADTSGAGGGGSTPIATPPHTEQTKRRRFHPLRNLRRIFRRRTINTATTVAGEIPASTLTGTTASSNSEKNLRSATLSSITSVASASSPSSPLTHQQLQDAYLTQSLPKSKSSYSSFLGGGKKHQSHDFHVNTETKTKSKHKHKNQKHQQQSKEYDFEKHHQQQQLTEAEDMFGTTTQTSAMYHHHPGHAASASSSTLVGAGSATKSSLLSQRQSMGVAVFPGAINRSFLTERQKMRSVGDSSQDLDSGSGNDSGTGGGGPNSLAMQRAKSGGGGGGGGGSASGGEMSDSQRSLSEGRLVDSDFSRDGLSQSHDSVFSESATASSLSIVLKAELADVLRKRRNRPDASDEDLGLPRSPASPQRRAASAQHHAAAAVSQTSVSNKSNMGEKHSEVSSLSLLSMNSNEGEDLLANSSTTPNTSSTNTEVAQERNATARYSRSSTLSSISMSSDILRHRDSSFDDMKDEVDLFSSDWQRLSHTAAKHKMAIRPAKKKGGPSRHHRRTLETSIPEANEELNKFVNKQLTEMKESDTKVKTRSLPPGVNAAKLMDESSYTATKESTNKATKVTNSNATQSTTTTTITSATTTTTTTTTNIFGLRNLTAKASAIFETKDTSHQEEAGKKSETAKKNEVLEKPSQHLETVETGFLRRLMHRNSKRSIAKTYAGGEEDQDVVDKKQNEPKKFQMSATPASVLDKQKNEFVTYESSYDDKRRESNRKEIYPEAKTIGQTVIANNFAMSAKDERKAEDRSPTKPKSGPAARQRYLPQNISNEDLIKISEEKTVAKESVASKYHSSEIFQSTSLIREVTKQQSNLMANSSAKVEHHFEKKPKIVGLSAFQQKISRSNDSFARASSNASLMSLDKSDDELASPTRLQTYDQKQRKSVEKSRSFRTYGEQKSIVSATPVHNNMPSLPDLSLNLRVPYYKEFIVSDKEYSSPSPPEPLDEKHTSLGFEINDNKLVKPERENRKSFTNYDKNIIMTTTTNGSAHIKTSPTKLLTPAAVVASFSTAVSSSANKNISEIESNIDMIVKSPFVSVIRKSIHLNEEQSDQVLAPVAPPSAFLNEKERPAMLGLRKEKSLSEENILNSPSIAAVTLRDKPAKKVSTLQYSASKDTPAKESERKSAPAANGKTSNGFRSNSTRRSSSVVESTEKSLRTTVPEFMKIQLNRVDPTRTSKSHLVLAKNVKETSAPCSKESMPAKNYNSSSMDDLSFRRLSSENVDINERISPPIEKRFSGVYHEAISKPAKICTGLPPKSPVKKTPTTPTTPPTPTIKDRQPARDLLKLAERKENNNNNNSHTNSLSLQERRRLFMTEERSKTEKKIEEIRIERKKSVSEELSKKCLAKSESEQRELTAKDLSPVDNCVILRKKSFASSVHSLNGNSINSSTTSSSSSNSSSNNAANKDDATPELMKVFARRSLKIKDEDLDKMLQTNGNSHLLASQTLKKFTSPCTNPGVDSDKENQSASDEKLDKLPKLETSSTIATIKTHNTQMAGCQTNGSVTNNINNNNRNSLADFRLVGGKTSHSALSLNNNTNNNNGCCSNNEISNANTNKNFLPSIKQSAGLRAMSIERNNNHNSALSPTKTSTTLERSTIKLGDLSSSSSTDEPINMCKTIERSATMAEFKGIHQRRAEWEQRAKEALK